MSYKTNNTIARLAILVHLGGKLYGMELPVVTDVHVGPTTPQAGALPNLLVGGGNKALLRFDLGLLPAGGTARVSGEGEAGVSCEADRGGGRVVGGAVVWQV